MLTYHPATLADEDPVLAIQEILSALDEFKDYKLIITYPNADNGGRSIIPYLLEYKKENSERVYLVSNLGQLKYLSVLKYASVVIGNSSSGIIEAPSFKVPTLNIGSRQRGRLCAASIVHCNHNKKDIVMGINHIFGIEFQKKMKDIVNPYGEGNATKKIISMIKRIDLTLEKKFYDLSREQ